MSAPASIHKQREKYVKTSKGRIESVKEIKGFSIKDFVPEEHFCSRSTKNPTILVNGKRGSGKSVFVRWLLGHLGQFPTAYAVVPTGKVDKTVVSCFPHVFREYDLDETKLSANHKIQKEKTQKFKAGKLKDAVSENDIRHLYVLDDCISKKEILRRSNTINQVMLEGRHYSATFVLTSQDINAPTPTMRQNFDWVFLLRTNSTRLLKNYYEYYADFFDSFELFKEVFREVTKDFGVMAINNRNETGDIEDIVFRAKANPDERPKLCLPMFWDKDYVKKLRKRKKHHLEKEKEGKDYIPVTTVHKKIGYKIEYPRSDYTGPESSTERVHAPKHHVSFYDIVNESRY